MRGLALAFVLGLALAGAALAASPTPLTTLCIGLPECGPDEGPVAAKAPDRLGPANQALAQENYAAALGLLIPLAEGGSSEAQYRLGDLYYKGQGTPQDYLAAGKWYARAAGQLDTPWAPEAQVNLAIMHALGQGMPVDLPGALMWDEIALACGSDLALAERDLLAARLGPVQAVRARQLAQEWLARHGRSRPTAATTTNRYSTKPR